MPELEFPNLEMQGKMLSLIELQSDWLQALRKGFSSHDEKDAADKQYKENRRLLTMVGDSFGKGVAADIWNVLEKEFKPILNLTDGTPDTPSGGSMQGEMENWVREDRGQLWADLTLDQKRESWKSFTVRNLDNVRELIQDARDGVIEFRDSLPN